MHKKYSYWQAVVFYVLINLIAGYGVTLFVDIKEIYGALTLPTWAPATWVFGVAWTINNILILTGNIWTLNSPHSLERTWLLRLQALSWLNYALFQWLSFGTGIPSLFFWPTFSMLILTLGSMYFAYRLDTKNKSFVKTVTSFRSITLTFSTLILWLSIASLLGYSIMMNN